MVTLSSNLAVKSFLEQLEFYFLQVFPLKNYFVFPNLRKDDFLKGRAGGMIFMFDFIFLEIQMKEEKEENPSCLNPNPGESSQIQISSSYSVRIPDPSRLSDPVRIPEFTLSSSSSSLAHPGAGVSGSQQSSPNSIPVINIIKPEPPDLESFSIRDTLFDIILVL